MDVRVLQTLALAARLHEGQVDKAGQPYIGHLIRVARNVAEMQEATSQDGRDPIYDVELLQAAILHDAFEDQPERYAQVEPSLPPAVRLLVRMVSRRRDETYEAFIERIAADGFEAVLIKLADLQDNLDPVRRLTLPQADRTPPGKYLAARERLRRALEDAGPRSS